MNYGIKWGVHWYVCRTLDDAAKLAALIQEKTGVIVCIQKTRRHYNFEFRKDTDAR